MFGSAVIVFREVLEAALVIGIVLAATRGMAGSRAWVAGGIAGGVAVALLVAAGAGRISEAFEGAGQELLNAAILGTAVLMLGWHSVWMRRHGAQIAREMQSVGRAVGSGARPLHVLAVVVGLAVLREGSEVVLFLYGISAGGTGAAGLLAGSLVGLAAGLAAGALMYFGLLRIPARAMFSVTGALLVLLAAGMAGQAAAYLVQGGVLPALVEPLWDASGWLPEGGVAGQLLHVLAGYDDRPSAMHVLAWFATVAAILGAGRWVNRGNRPAQEAGRAATAAGLVIAAALTLQPGDARADHVVYSPLVEYGEKAIEIRGDYDFDPKPGLDGGQSYKLEYEWTPMSRWLSEILVEYEREPAESLTATEIASENIFQLTEQGQYWADFGVLAEFAYSLERNHPNALEIALLGQKDWGRNEVRVNLVFEQELEDGADLEMEYRWQYRYRLDERYEPGIEMYGGAGEWGDVGNFDEHQQQIGPGLYGKFRTSDGAVKYELALLFGLTDPTPAETLRFMIEYEF
ncbi:MAG: FTR1 family protein [Steroidobacteraceae bacterium]